MNVKYTKEMLEPVVKMATSVADVMRKLGIKRAGGSHSHLVRRIKFFEINTSHFTGKTKSKGRCGIRKPADEILIIRETGAREKYFLLKRALVEKGKEYKCETCHSLPIWNGCPLTLQIDHKNRNWLDNRYKNLRFLCPNCHSQTLGYNGQKMAP